MSESRETTGRDGSLTLHDLVAQSSVWDARFSQIRVCADELQFEATGLPRDGALLPMDQASRTRLFRKIGAPERYLEAHSAALQAAMLSEDASRGAFGPAPTLVMDRNELVTISRGDLLSLADREVVSTVEEVLGNDADDLHLVKIARTVEHLDVELVSPSKATAIRRGDIVQSGLHIVHHRFGDQATVIEAFFNRLVCSNGLTQRECASRPGYSRMRKFPVIDPEARPRQLEQIRRITRHTWDGLQARLEALRVTSERSANVPKLLKQQVRQAKLSERKILPKLLTAWQNEGAEDTIYAAVNALTAVATHDPTLKGWPRRVLALVAGLLSFSTEHLCPRCFSILSAGKAETHDGD